VSGRISVACSGPWLPSFTSLADEVSADIVGRTKFMIWASGEYAGADHNILSSFFNGINGVGGGARVISGPLSFVVTTSVCIATLNRPMSLIVCCLRPRRRTMHRNSMWSDRQQSARCRRLTALKSWRSRISLPPVVIDFNNLDHVRLARLVETETGVIQRLRRFWAIAITRRAEKLATQRGIRVLVCSEIDRANC
jgi:hypothetical protein